MNPQLANKFRFLTLLGFSQLFSALVIIFIFVWLLHFEGGFAWNSDPKRQFNFHPLFMILGFMICYTQAALVYRTFPQVAKPTLKLVHLTFQVLGLIFIIIALVAIFDSNNHHVPPYPNMFSLHSWLGMGTVVLFCLQLWFGIVAFLTPGFPQSIKIFYLPIHTFFGCAIFIMAVATSLMGIYKKASYDPKYSEFTAAGVLANCLGLVLILLAMCVTYLLANNDYKRQPRQDDELIIAAKF